MQEMGRKGGKKGGKKGAKMRAEALTPEHGARLHEKQQRLGGPKQRKNTDTTDG